MEVTNFHFRFTVNMDVHYLKKVLIPSVGSFVLIKVLFVEVLNAELPSSVACLQ